MKEKIIRCNIFPEGYNLNKTPKMVSNAYIILKKYIISNGEYSERMAAQLLSMAKQKQLEPVVTFSERSTPPRWLKKHCEEGFNIPIILTQKFHWLDHMKWMRIKKTKEYILVGEPYREDFRGIGLQEMKELIEVCENLNINCHISASSIHYPGKTLALLFSGRKSES